MVVKKRSQCVKVSDVRSGFGMLRPFLKAPRHFVAFDRRELTCDSFGGKFMHLAASGYHPHSQLINHKNFPFSLLLDSAYNIVRYFWKRGTKLTVTIYAGKSLDAHGTATKCCTMRSTKCMDLEPLYT